MISRRFLAIAVGSFALIAGDGRAEGEERPRAGGVHQQGSGGGAPAQDSPDKIVAACRAALLVPGPNGRRGRANAVTQLFSMDHKGAHALLQEYVGPGPDPDGVRRLVLSELPRRLANRQEKPFWASQHADQIRLSYVLKLVHHFDGEDRGSVLARELQGLARDAIVEMAHAGMVKGFSDLLKNGNAELRLQAIRAMGMSRNPAWAVLLAEQLADRGEAADVAQHAIYNLTYQKFTDPQAFAAWWQANQDLGYTELAERAARGASAARRREVQRLEQQNIQMVVQMVELLARSSSKDRWKQIGAFIARNEPEGLRVATLRQLRSVLADLSIDPKGTDAVDRLELFAALSKRLDGQPVLEERALLLEVASYLCAPGEAAPRQAQEQRLLAAIQATEPLPMRLAALRGLRRFFSPDNRQVVVGAVRRALDADAREELAVAVDTLQGIDWPAPKPDDPGAQEWLTVLRRVLVQPTLPVALRVDVVKVLDTPDVDGNRMRQALQMLLMEMPRDELATEVRSQVLLRMVRMLPNKEPERSAAARQYVGLLAKLQESKDVQIRLAAARRTAVPDNLPAKTKQELGQLLVQSIGSRLLVETDGAVFAAQVTALRNLAAERAHVSGVNSRLREALDTLRSKPTAGERLAAVVAGLEKLALNEQGTTAEWVETCRRLLAPPLPQRESILTILQYHIGRENGAKLTNATPEDKRAIAELVIQTAVLRPETEPWAGDRGLSEAAMVETALQTLLTAKDPNANKLLDGPRVRLTVLRCLAAAQKAPLLEQFARAWLADTDQILKGVDRDAARLLFARSLAQQGKLTEAWASGMQAVAGTMLAERLRVTESIADAMVARQKAREASPLFADLIKRTPQASPDYWRRLEKHLRTRFQLDPKQGQALLKELNRWTSGRSNLTPEQKAAAAKLRAELQGRAAPQK